MNKSALVFLLFVMLVSSQAWSQSKFYRGTIGLQAGTMNYAGDLSNDFYRFRTSNPFTALSYSHYLSSLVDLRGGFSMGSIGYDKSGGNSFNVDVFSAGLDVKLKLMRKEDPRFLPFVFAGLGFQDYSNWILYDKNRNATLLDDKGKEMSDKDVNGFQSAISAGVGCQFHFSDRVFLTIEERFVFPGTDAADGIREDFPDKQLMHTIGLSFGLFPWKDSDLDQVSDKFDKCPDTPAIAVVNEDGCPIDTDLDGVADFEDACPDVIGSASGKGCPDADGDHVLDSDDACPQIAGLIERQGCPDTDLDGVIDMDDECPEIPGWQKFKGCPDMDDDGVPEPKDVCPDSKKNAPVNDKGCPIDTDADGVEDYLDKCPGEAGLSSNNGCPEVKEEVRELFKRALNGIKFESGNSVIKAESFAILDTVVKVMNDNPTYLLKIYGHTDNAGDPQKNLELSYARANAVAGYLSSKGMKDRITETIGFGDQKPIADNATKEGKKLNRRVEFVVEFKR